MYFKYIFSTNSFQSTAVNTENREIPDASSTALAKLGVSAQMIITTSHVSIALAGSAKI